MTVETTLQDRCWTVARIAPHEDDLRSLAVIRSYATDRLFRLALGIVLAIEFEFPLAFSSHLYRLGNRGQPDSAFLVDEQHPADESNPRGRQLAIVVYLIHQ